MPDPLRIPNPFFKLAGLDILVQSYSYLSLAELKKIRLVNKQFRDAADIAAFAENRVSQEDIDYQFKILEQWLIDPDALAKRCKDGGFAKMLRNNLFLSLKKSDLNWAQRLLIQAALMITMEKDSR
ncbi:MAG: hypothetical protein LCH30_11215 [Proteobacteria bacterium]|nr:hypothetical protein [Pseudomonadota bacterium]